MFVFGFVRTRKQFNRHSEESRHRTVYTEDSVTQIERKDEAERRGRQSLVFLLQMMDTETKRGKGFLTQSC